MRGRHCRGRSKWWPTTTAVAQRGEERLPVRRSRASPRRPRRAPRARGRRSPRRPADRSSAANAAACVVQVRKRRLGVEHLDGVDQPLARQGVAARPHAGCAASGRTGGGRRRDRPGPGCARPPPRATRRTAARSVRNSPMTSPAWVRSSSPTTTRHGSWPASSSAPRMALWSVMHSTSMPDATTASSSSSGVVVAVARPHRVGVQVDPHPARTHGLCEVGMAADRLGAGGGHESYDPLRATSPITRLTPASPPGSHSRSVPTATTSSSMRCRVEAMVTSRTGSAERAAPDHEALGADREVAADRVDAGVQAVTVLHEQPVADRGSSSSGDLVAGPGIERLAADARRATSSPAPPSRSTPCPTAGRCSVLCRKPCSTPPSISTLRREARPSPSCGRRRGRRGSVGSSTRVSDRGGDRLAHPVGERRAPLQHALAGQRARRRCRGTTP